MRYYLTRMCLALVALVAITTLGVAAVGAYAEDSVPELLPDRIVVQQGVPVTVTLNRFTPGQQVTLHLRQPVTGTTGNILGAFPATIDANGNGIALVTTTGLGPGNYLVSVGVDGAAEDLGFPYTAFAVIEGAGFLGPRTVRAIPSPTER